MNATQSLCTGLICLVICPLLITGILLVVMGSKKDDDISFVEGAVLLFVCASLAGVGFILIPAM